MGCELFIAFLRIAGDTDGAEQFAVWIANQHAAALGKDLIVGGANQVLHEQRPFFGADAHQR